MVVVHVVVCGRVQPFEKTVAGKAAWRNLVACVTQYVEQNAPKRKQEKNGCMYGQNHRQHWDDGEFQHRFQRVKREGGVRRGVGGFVVNEVEAAVQLRVVHQPVYPVEVGVVCHDKEGEAEKPIYPAVFRYLEVEMTVAHFPKEKHAQCHAAE